MASRLDSRFNLRTDIFDSITPKNVRQRDIAAPSGEWKPANWLPVQWTSSNVGAGEDAFVCSSGKVVALSRQAEVCPAGLRGSLATAGIAYTASDVTWGVTDLATGARVSAAVSYTQEEVALALLERGLVPNDSFTGHAAFDYALDTLSAGQIVEIIESFISKPVGIAAYDLHVYAGSVEDGDQWFLNYNKQPLVQFLTEAEMVVPHRVASATTSDSVDFTAALVSAPAGTGEFVVAGSVYDATGLNALSRYSALVATTDSVVGIGLAVDAVAKNTTRTPITCDAAGVLVSEKTSIAGIAAEGDWYLDASVGVLFIHSAAHTTHIADSTVVFSYSYYDDAAAGATAHRYIHFDGEARPGDLLGYDEESNFVVSGASADLTSGTAGDALGRVHFVISEPKGNLDKVKTAFNLTNMNAAGKMPGTATGGFSDMITLSQEEVADQVAVLLVRI